MIGKPEWFKRRKYGGWGLVPATLGGYIYIIVFIALIFLVHSLPFFNTTARIIITLVMVGILIIDTLSIMTKINRDERERIHEAIAERNALWMIVGVLAAGVAYQAARAAILQTTSEIDWIIVIALFLGLIVKAITNIYLDRKN